MLLSTILIHIEKFKDTWKSLQEYVVLAIADALDEFTNKSYVSNHISCSTNINFITLKLPFFYVNLSLTLKGRTTKTRIL